MSESKVISSSRERCDYVAILLPLRCSEEYPVEKWVASVNESFGQVKSKLFIGVDEDDSQWQTWGARVLASEVTLAMPYEIKIFPPVDPAIICPIWASLALTAYKQGCSYFVLWGDDVSVSPPNWFAQFVMPRLKPDELGCVAPVDANDPSLATFPIVTRAHFDLFGRLFSPKFVNQDADPYLFELYRRVGRSTLLTEARLTNLKGGSVSLPWKDSNPRYERRSLIDWKKSCLSPDARTLARAVSNQIETSFVTIDVVVPSVRTPTERLRKLTSLRDPPQSSIKYIIIIDDPTAPNLSEILKLQNERVRVRVNRSNVGAPASRSRGLAEACAEWVLFFDDDVDVTQDCLDAYVLAAAERGTKYSGFVGTTILPSVTGLLHEATRLSDITFFYNLPQCMGNNVPWGVTANLMVRRVEGLYFDMDYSKTGGGEDVDYCIRLVQALDLPLGRVSEAAVLHEWWSASDIQAYLCRFWKWTMGDGYLLYKHPQYVYLSFPNAIEVSFFLLFALIPFFTFSRLLSVLLAIWIVEIFSETLRALQGPHSRHLDVDRRIVAAALSSVVKNVVDAGHFAFHIIHMRPTFALHRFDFFLGLHNVPSQERVKFATRNAIWLVIVVLGTLR